MDNKKRVLFICVHNSGRSQMAEGFLKALGEDKFRAESAGLKPREINKLVIEVMQEKGIDISNNTSDSIFDFFKEGRLYDYVITVCDEAIESQCPIFPGIARRLHWGFRDPQKVKGNHAEQLDQIRKIGDAIETQVTAFIKNINRL
jgi:arsenate reductase